MVSPTKDITVGGIPDYLAVELLKSVNCKRVGKSATQRNQNTFLSEFIP
jgi:hypothetical protein